ncbi:MAG: DUF5698 domain-containing protein [Anaerolineales bacterium]|nr:DUF5698 domain-containing protein [Anaerolineales bacterium]
MLEVILAALYIFLLRLVDVSAMTLRILMVMRGRKALAWVFGFLQALIFIVAIQAVLSNIGNFLNVLGYAAGFATGTVVGMRLEEWWAVGYGHIRVISSRHGVGLAESLREAGYGVTEVPGRGKDGSVDLLGISVPRRRVRKVRELVQSIDPDAFITVEDVRPLSKGFWPN